MFRRPALYHPYKASAPAGFRIKDLFLKRCFNLFPGLDFANARSPAPSSLSSPVRGAGDSEDDAPPTLRLADLFAACVGGCPHRPTAGTPGNRRPKAQPNAGPAKDALPKPQPRRKGKGAKHPSFTSIAQRSRDVPLHRRSQHLKEKREALHERKLDAHERRASQACDEMRRLVKEAKALMKPGHMTREDYIFLKQLKNLALDQELDHELERCREQMARAAAETEQRRQDHEARDKEAERLHGEQSAEEAQEKQKKKVEEFMRRYEGEMLAEAMRADEQRRRAHEEAERKLREEQERRFHQELAYKAKEDEERRMREERQRQERELRICQELTRKAREEEERQRREEEERRLQEEKRRQEQEELVQRLLESIERARRLDRERRKREEEERRREEEANRQRQEARERFIREERERLAREAEQHQAHWRDEQAGRAAQEEQIRQYFILYEGKWNELRTSNTLPPIDVREMPWPVLGVVSSADQITCQAVRTFLFHPQRTGVQGKSARDKVKAEVLRFHPDKFNTRIVPKITPSQQAVAQEIAGAIARILTTIMAEEVE